MNSYNDFFYYSDILVDENLLGDVYVGFSNAENDEEKFMYTLDIMKRNGMFPSKLESCKHRLSDSNIINAQDNRGLGNELFRLKEYLKSLNCYTKSIILSKNNTECYSFALANRSAALFHLKEYQLCLNDIHRALQFNYPTKLFYKLYERAGNAERLLGNSERAKNNYKKCLKFLDKASISNDIKTKIKKCIEDNLEKCDGLIEHQHVINEQRTKEEIVGGKHDSISSLSKFIELRYSDDFGQGLYATCNINPGDIVAIDKPYICGFSMDSTFICCYNNCMKKCLAAIPCAKCSLAIYCDDECMQKSHEEDHFLECPILYYINKLPGIPLINRLTVKWFTKEIIKFGIDNYCNKVRSLNTFSVNLLTKEFDRNGFFNSNDFCTAYSMAINDDKISLDVKFFFNCIAVEILNYMSLGGFEIYDHHKATVGASLVHMLCVLDLNCFKSRNFIIPLSPKDSLFKPLMTGTLDPTFGLFNHSCDPNILLCNGYENKNIVYKAIQPIPKGKQLFVSYGIHFTTNKKDYRKKILKEQYKFICKCQPCEENWPIARFTPNRISSLNILNSSCVNAITDECIKFAKFKEFIKPEDYKFHLQYLQNFLKLLYENVKRPFSLYEECVEMILQVHRNLA
ncbi:SET and MYND domain-containing protein 4-like [Daktulosphaira vitifoliae]|uniref:SET and MYND domain-containing protein 4-like n=1 Tax=Daktulosphaira vitifoliae TaxID=58002 RepID=UPI0021AAAD6B|nr:SET and MYND domain-containing protein 4-like [Daktulosphaira vitifoliae]